MINILDLIKEEDLNFLKHELMKLSDIEQMFLMERFFKCEEYPVNDDDHDIFIERVRMFPIFQDNEKYGFYKQYSSVCQKEGLIIKDFNGDVDFFKHNFPYYDILTTGKVEYIEISIINKNIIDITNLKRYNIYFLKAVPSFPIFVSTFFPNYYRIRKIMNILDIK